jgi:HSP20 family protein
MPSAIERWTPFREMIAMRNRIDQLFEDALAWPGGEWVARFGEKPVMDIYETEGTIKVDVPLPGVKPEEVELTITGNTLTIKGEHKTKEEVKEGDYYRRELHYGTFTRSVMLPETADVAKPEATFENGVLTVSFPKVATVEPTRIEIKPKELKARHVG